MLSTSLLEGSTCSDAAQSRINHRMYRLRQQCRKMKIDDKEVLGLSLFPFLKVSRYVTKASLRHITANDEASSLSGDFIIAHHSPASDK